MTDAETQGALPTSTDGLSAEALEHLELAGQAYSRDAEAEAHLARAHALAPEHLAVQVARYRFHFYKGRLREARGQLEACFRTASAQGGLPADWRVATPESHPFGDFEALWARFFMFALKAHAYLSLRLGEFEEGRMAAAKALELDPLDRVGARVLLDVLERRGREELG